MKAASLIAVLVGSMGAITVAAAEDEFFEKQVRPVLANRCAECHGDEEPESGLSLTSRAGVLKGGKRGPAAIAGQPDQSLLVNAVRRMGKLKMPPDAKLREDEIAALTHWVEAGMPWPDAASHEEKPKGERVVTDADRQHWSFRPIADPAVPAVRDATWLKTTVDAFILSKLEAAGLAPSPAVDRRTLIRRAYYDLIGLPPSWEDVQAFAEDSSSDAFERVVDRLLAMPEYGERWGRHWLDVARFADTKDGVLMYGDDRVRPFAYTYRDYVIRAFNEDVSFDRFVHEQLAADQIEPAVEPWRLAAMGFLTLGRMFDNNIHDIIDDRIDVVSRGLMGLTVACARCHDHKYDPIPTADYYSLYGVFASSETPLELPPIENPDNLAGGAEFEQRSAPKREELRKMLEDQYALLTEAARDRVDDYLVRVATTEPDLVETAIFFMSLAPEDLRAPITARWRRYIAERATAEDPVFGPWHDLRQLSESQPTGATTDVGGATFASQAVDVLNRWKTVPEGTGPGQLNALVRDALLKATLNSRADVAKAYGGLLKQVYAASKVAAAGTASPPPDAAARQQLLDILVSRESPGWFPKSETRRFMSRMETDAFGAKMQELDRMAVTSKQVPARAMVLEDSEVLTDPCIFVRGNASQRGKPVPRQFLAILSPGERTAFSHGSGRLDLAKAIASPQNPLTARVLVNRVWMHHFGEPLVSTPSDFGTRSTPPVQSELLDHLATRFMREGWSLKKLHRWIMLSSVYQQGSTPAPDLVDKTRAVDVDNRLCWRMARRRLEFEAMRDTLLAISGRLKPRLGGRPVDVAGDPQCQLRTVYGLVDRQSLPGIFRAFDFASPDQSVERRPRTMVPQQALFALNSPFMVEQAKSLAARPEIPMSEIQGQTESTGRITAMYRVVFAREPSAEEMVDCLAFVAEPMDSGSQLTVWQQLAQVLLASNELMYLD